MLYILKRNLQALADASVGIFHSWKIISVLEEINCISTHSPFPFQSSAANVFIELSQLLMKQADEGVDGSVIEHVATEEVSGLSNVLKASSMSVQTLATAGQQPQVTYRHRKTNLL